MNSFINSFIHDVVRLMPGPYPPPKQAIHAVRYNAPSFKFLYLIFSATLSSGGSNTFFLV